MSIPIGSPADAPSVAWSWARIVGWQEESASKKLRQPQYVPGLDLLRFFAAFVVMVYHLSFWSWAYPGGQVAQASRGVADFQSWGDLTAFGWAGVQIFFVISGFVIAISGEYATSIRFFVSRFVRLVPAVWICATITFVTWLLIDVGYPMHHLIAFARSVIFFPFPDWIDSVYWTLGVEISFYAIVFALIVMKRFAWLKAVMCTIGLVSTMYWVTFTLVDRDGSLFPYLRSLQESRLAQLALLQHGVFFGVGVLLWLQLMKKPKVDQTIWLVVFFVGGCLQIAGETSLKLDRTGLAFSPVWPCLIWLGAMPFFWIAVKNNSRLHKLPTWTLQTLRRLGLMTYPLYLLHNVTGGAIMGALVNSGLPSTWGLLLAMLAITALSWWVSSVPEPILQRASRAVFDTVQARFKHVSPADSVRSG